MFQNKYFCKTLANSRNENENSNDQYNKHE